MNGIKIENVKGRVVDYTILTAEKGFCFYDKDETDRNYLTSITTPITDPNELERKYIVVQGNAEELNKALEEQRLKEMENGDNTNI